jgi:N-acetyltransferase 10
LCPLITRIRLTVGGIKLYPVNVNLDLQMLSDAPAHHLFVLMSPVKQSQTTLPEILAVIQVCMEGRLSKESVTKTINRGHQAAGDLIPWTISQYYLVSL